MYTHVLHYTYNGICCMILFPLFPGGPSPCTGRDLGGKSMSLTRLTCWPLRWSRLDPRLDHNRECQAMGRFKTQKLMMWLLELLFLGRWLRRHNKHFVPCFFFMFWQFFLDLKWCKMGSCKLASLVQLVTDSIQQVFTSELQKLQFICSWLS